MIVSSMLVCRTISALGSCQSNLNATEDFGSDGPTALLPTNCFIERNRRFGERESAPYSWTARYRNGYMIVSHSLREKGWLKGERFMTIGWSKGKC